MALKLGKQPAKFDDRDLPLKSMIKAAVIPSSYDFDQTHPHAWSYPMFANDQFGCCVIAGRAHQTIRFEALEQGFVVPIADREVLNEYFRETGGVDSGLVVSESLHAWRRRGWVAANKRYRALGYARINHRILNDVRTAIYADVGVGIGMTITERAMEQFEAGKGWEIASSEGENLGGHYVYVPAYWEDGAFTCVTWGRRQTMSVEFFKRYVDEAWAVFDANNAGRKSGILDFTALESFLQRIG